MQKGKEAFKKFISWVIGNTAWDYFKLGLSIVSSFVSTWKVYAFPSVTQWFINMDFPVFLAIAVTFIGFLTVIWVFLSTLFRVYQWLKPKIINNDEPIKPLCKIRKDGNEVYIDVENPEWFIDIMRISFHCHFLYKDNVVLDPLEWIQDSNKKGETFIQRRKTKTIHFATIRPLDRLYNLHLLERDLEFPFSNDRGIEFSIEGFSSAPITMEKKRNNKRHIVYS